MNKMKIKSLSIKIQKSTLKAMKSADKFHKKIERKWKKWGVLEAIISYQLSVIRQSDDCRRPYKGGPWKTGPFKKT